MKYKEIAELTERVIRLEDTNDSVKEDLAELKNDVKDIKDIMFEFKNFKMWLLGVGVGVSGTIVIVWELIKHLGIGL